MSDNTVWDGFPQNPETLAWHWMGMPPLAFVMAESADGAIPNHVKDFLHKLPVLWIPEQNIWLLNGTETTTPAEIVVNNKTLAAVGGGFTYHGPCT